MSHGAQVIVSTPRRKRVMKLAIGAGVALALGGLTAACCPVPARLKPAVKTPVVKPVVKPKPPVNPPTISLAEYNRLVVGRTTEAQAKAIIGSNGHLEDSSTFDSYHSEFLTWAGNAEFSEASLGFDATPDNPAMLLSYKSEYGLR